MQMTVNLLHANYKILDRYRRVLKNVHITQPNGHAFLCLIQVVLSLRKAKANIIYIVFLNVLYIIQLST